ncbi:MAG: hypothetical protein NT069_27145 [Planctomycetota bacterium]|nr:hypothetical protein [Planctomycetota bacterium]
MARIPRKLLFDPTEVEVYHCINRCVRRVRLMRDAPDTGKSYNHRKEWLLGRMAELAGMVASDFIGFSVLERLGIPEAGRTELLRGFDGRFRRVAGFPESMAQESAKWGCRFLHGMPSSRAAYGGQSSLSSTDKT